MVIKQIKRPKRKKHRIFGVQYVQLLQFIFRDNILKVACNRSDDVTKAVIARTQYEYDLVGAEAVS